jgi:hypothetical protein
MFLARREDSSELDCGCAPCDGEKGVEFEETDEVRLRFWRVDEELTGEKVLREGLLDDDVWRLADELKVVDIGVKPRRC